MTGPHRAATQVLEVEDYGCGGIRSTGNTYNENTVATESVIACLEDA